MSVKGADEEDYSAKLVSSAVLWLGHLGLILRGDNGPALQSVIDRSMQLLRLRVTDWGSESALGRSTNESSAPYDSQSNGGTDVGVMLVRSIFRTLELCLGCQIGKLIHVQHAVVPWFLLRLTASLRGSE